MQFFLSGSSCFMSCRLLFEYSGKETILAESISLGLALSERYRVLNTKEKYEGKDTGFCFYVFSYKLEIYQ